MAEKLSRESLNDKEEVLGIIDASFDKKLSLEDVDSAAGEVNLHATMNKQQPKVTSIVSSF